MGTIDELLADNAVYADAFDHGDLPAAPARGLCVVACTDAEGETGARPRPA
jgi:hypothetical protein